MVKLVDTRDLKSLGPLKGHAGSTPAPGTIVFSSQTQMEHISSRQNAHFRQALKLAGSARERTKSGLVLLDGSRLIGAYAAQFGLVDATLLISEEGAERSEIRNILSSTPPRRAFVLAPGMFSEISQVETPEGITAIVGAPVVAQRSPNDFCILLDGIQDPGNLGALLRTATAAGATAAYLAKGCADPWSPKSLRGDRKSVV